MSVKHSQQRVQFGVPIGRFQRVQDHVIRLVNHLDAARWTTAEALWKLDTGRPATDAVHMAKAVTSEGYLEACNAAHEVHAGQGSLIEYGLVAHTQMSRTLFALPRRSALAQAPDGRRARVVAVSEQPFAGVTVLEFGHFIAVPWAGQVLADGGAHVIKIEPLEGEPSRHIAPLGGGESRHFLIRNRGKHSLPLDLRHRDARAHSRRAARPRRRGAGQHAPRAGRRARSRVRAAGAALSADHRGDRDRVRRAGSRRGPRRDGPRRPGAQRPHGHGRQGAGRPAHLGRVAHRGLHGGRAAGLRRRLRALSPRADRARAGAWTPRSCWPRSRCRTT